MTYAFLSPAQGELQESVDFYSTRQAGLGEEFAAEVVNTIHRILANPEAWARLSPNTRRCRLQRFPYGLVYQIQPDGILIVAVMHRRKRPGYWRARLRTTPP
jgi:hypothetical protein